MLGLRWGRTGSVFRPPFLVRARPGMKTWHGLLWKGEPDVTKEKGLDSGVTPEWGARPPWRKAKAMSGQV